MLEFTNERRRTFMLKNIFSGHKLRSCAERQDAQDDQASCQNLS